VTPFGFLGRHQCLPVASRHHPECHPLLGGRTRPPMRRTGLAAVHHSHAHKVSKLPTCSHCHTVMASQREGPLTSWGVAIPAVVSPPLGWLNWFLGRLIMESAAHTFSPVREEVTCSKKTAEGLGLGLGSAVRGQVLWKLEMEKKHGALPQLAFCHLVGCTSSCYTERMNPRWGLKYLTAPGDFLNGSSPGGILVTRRD
jgi:hypothetical protein